MLDCLGIRIFRRPAYVDNLTVVQCLIGHSDLRKLCRCAQLVRDEANSSVASHHGQPSDFARAALHLRERRIGSSSIPPRKDFANLKLAPLAKVLSHPLLQIVAFRDSQAAHKQRFAVAHKISDATHTVRVRRVAHAPEAVSRVVQRSAEQVVR